MKLKQQEIGQKRMAITNNSINTTLNKSLSIQINLSGLSFCILDITTNTITDIDQIWFKDIKNPETLLDAVKHAFNTKTVLHQAFKSITVIHTNAWQTLVPKDLFDENLLTDYLKYNTKILKSDFVAYDTTSFNINNIYVPFTSVNNYFFEHFGSFTYKHNATILVEALNKLEKNNENDVVYINFNKNTINIIVFKKGILQLYNTFEINTNNDLVYYVLFTLEQLVLNPETINTILLGNITKDSNYYKSLYKYIRYVSMINFKTEVDISSIPLHKHHYFTILNSF